MLLAMLNDHTNTNTMKKEIGEYNDKQSPGDKEICDQLANLIDNELTKAENRIWHSHPVWFLEGNPIVGYSTQKAGIRLMFWSGADFEEEKLSVRCEKYRSAGCSALRHPVGQISEVLRTSMGCCSTKHTKISFGGTPTDW